MLRDGTAAYSSKLSENTDSIGGTAKQAENSEVLPAGLVAVVVMKWPAAGGVIFKPSVND